MAGSGLNLNQRCRREKQQETRETHRTGELERQRERARRELEAAEHQMHAALDAGDSQKFNEAHERRERARKLIGDD